MNAKRARPSGEANQETHSKIQNALLAAFQIAEDIFHGQKAPNILDKRMEVALTELNSSAEKASTGFTNIVTALAIKAALPTIDVRYHQVQIQKDQNPHHANFNFRGISEKIVYPFLNSVEFSGAKSGWQTRTFERPKPYTLDYDENIGSIKTAFLQVYDLLENGAVSGATSLTYLFYLQLAEREKKSIKLTLPRTKDVNLITELFRRHFFYQYKNSRGASRLPVLAIYSIYQTMMEEVARYKGKVLLELQEHSAADSQTGSIGDIEVTDGHSVFEAVEIKHDIPLEKQHILTAAKKIGSCEESVKRYYILTTYSNCNPDHETLEAIENAKSRFHCEVIANGVIPSIKYYLRMLQDPSDVFKNYVNLLKTDKTIAHEHREIWNKIATN